MNNPLVDRAVRVARDLLNGIPHRAAVGDTYGDLEDDFSGNELVISWEMSDVDTPEDIKFYPVYRNLCRQIGRD